MNNTNEQNAIQNNRDSNNIYQNSNQLNSNISHDNQAGFYANNASDNLQEQYKNNFGNNPQTENRNTTIILENKKISSQQTPQLTNKEKKASKGFNGITVIALCLICCIITSAISVGLVTLKNSKNSDIDAIPSKNSQNNSTNLNNTALSENEKKEETIIINSENSVSPATAVAEKVNPSIVGIRVTTVTNYGPYGNHESTGEGSGVIYTDDGYIITNYHVIADTITSSGEQNPNATLSVYLNQDTTKEYIGDVIGYEQSADLAVIKIKESGLTEIEIGDSSKINVGEIAIAIGNPGGLEFMGSITQGIISGLNRSIQTEDSYENLSLIQTDAAINPGNSGGALCNVNGELIGINSVKLVETGYESMGFAIPSNDVVKICDDIIKNGTDKMVYLGLEFNERFSADVLKAQGYPEGIVVSNVAENSPASNAGFETDDILVSFNGKTIKSINDLTNAKKSCSSGDKIYAKVYRLKLEGFGFTTKWVGEYIDLEVNFK